MNRDAMNPLVLPRTLLLLLVVTPVLGAQTAEPDPWSVSQTGEASENGEVRLLTQEAATPVKVGGRTLTPRLCIRQRVASYEVFVSFETYLGHEDPSLTLRFDREPPEVVRWTRAGNGRGAIAPDSESLVYRFLRHNELSVEIVPPGESAITVHFDLRELASALHGSAD